MAKLTTANAFLMPVVLLEGGGLHLQDVEVNDAYRWWFIKESLQLILLFDYAMGRRPGHVLCLSWTESNLWADAQGNFLLFVSNTGWPMDTVLRMSLPRAGMDTFEQQPKVAFHWLTGKKHREFIVGFEDGRCAYYGAGAAWTQPHGTLRSVVLGDRRYLLVSFHYLGKTPTEPMNVFEMAEGVYYRPLSTYKQRNTLVRLLREHSRGDVIVSLETFEPLKMRNVAVLPFVSF